MKFLPLIFIVLLVGCSPLSDTEEKQTKSTKLVTDAQTDMVGVAPVMGSNNVFHEKVEIGKLPELKKSVDSKISTDMLSSYSRTEKICAAVAVFFFACSSIMLPIGLWLIYMVFSKSAAMRATMALADNAGASMMSVAASAADPAMKAMAHAAEAQIEKIKRRL